ncbi:MAG TPA: 3,4-dihydroxy-2-butanone-4-phosphate synthase [Myxococcota bacterium]|jgi:3,4-dihydroxy 2-butanone 4-phosphate synthase/GTP cyclohydrolase II|nr:3,4-dihydroxy-2-butanone-4-phosphate synthase [Myxococcota bacterium]
MDAGRVKKAIQEIRAGRMVILVDDEDRENEGDLCMAAQFVTPEAVNFMARHGRGLVCLTLTEEHATRLQLSPMVDRNTSPYGTAFTVSIEAARGVTTGISTHDRAHTILTAVADDARADQLVRPGHVFPLRARQGGVLARVGQTEGSVDLARLAGLKPAGVICEIMRDDGTMARMPDLEDFSRRHGVMLLTIQDIISYRLQRESLVRRVHTQPGVELRVPGMRALTGWTAHAYVNTVNDMQALALVKGEILPGDVAVVRVQPHTVLGNVFGVGHPDQGARIRRALDVIEEAGKGVLLYLHSAPNLVGELAGNFSAPGGRSSAMVMRDVGIGSQILHDLGVETMKLMNNPARIPGVEGFGLRVVEFLPFDEDERRGADVLSIKPGSGGRGA